MTNAFQDLGLPFRSEPLARTPLRIYHDGSERKQLNDFIKKYNSHYSCYIGVYIFEDEDRETSIIFDKIALDFDSTAGDSGLEVVKQDFLSLKKNFCDPLEIIPIVEFTGGKGLQVFMYFPRIKIKNTKITLKKVQEYIQETCKLQTSDPHIYGDTSRIMRLPNTKYIKNQKWNKRYCIPLFPEELEVKTMAEIIELSASPRTINYAKNYSVPLRDLVLQMSRDVGLEKIEAFANKKTYEPRVSKEEHISYFCASAQHELSEGTREGSRDLVLCGLIQYLKHVG